MPKLTTATLIHHANEHGYTGRIDDRPSAERPGGSALIEAAQNFVVLTPEVPSEVVPVAAAPGSQIAIADEFAAQHADCLRYVLAEKKWFHFDRTSWREDATGHVRDRIRYGLGRLSLATSGAEALARTLASDRTLRGVESIAQVDRRLAATVEQWDADPWVLCTPGGIVDLRTGELRPATPQDYCRKITAVAPAPAGMPFPNWQRVLDNITGGDAEHTQYFQMVAGYCLVGEIVDQAFFIPVGETNSGKTTSFEAWRAIMGDYATTAAPETFLENRTGSRATNDLAEIMGARMVIAAEPDEGQHLSAARIKRMCGGDRQRVRHLYQSGQERTAGFKVILHCNQVPHMRPDPAVQRRLHIIPAGRTIPKAERDRRLPEKLRDEYPAILRWMIDGCLAWQKAGGLKQPHAVEQRTQRYFDSEDPIAGWLQERVERDPVAWTATDALYEDYLGFVRADGGIGLAKDQFSKHLAAVQWDGADGNGKAVTLRFERKTRGKQNIRGFTGLTLRPNDARGAPSSDENVDRTPDSKPDEF